jgi:hypothetical protein
MISLKLKVLILVILLQVSSASAGPSFATVGSGASSVALFCASKVCFDKAKKAKDVELAARYKKLGWIFLAAGSAAGASCGYFAWKDCHQQDDSSVGGASESVEVFGPRLEELISRPQKPRVEDQVVVVDPEQVVSGPVVCRTVDLGIAGSRPVGSGDSCWGCSVVVPDEGKAGGGCGISDRARFSFNQFASAGLLNCHMNRLVGEDSQQVLDGLMKEMVGGDKHKRSPSELANMDVQFRTAVEILDSELRDSYGDIADDCKRFRTGWFGRKKDSRLRLESELSEKVTGGDRRWASEIVDSALAKRDTFISIATEIPLDGQQ